MSKEELVERVRPWALVFKDMLDAVDQGSDMPFGDMILHFCILRGVAYPPEDIVQTLLTAVFRRAAKGAPAPKGFA